MNFSGPETRTGRFILAPNSAYHTFEPKALPFKINWDEELAKKFGEAERSIGELSEAGRKMKNPNLLILPYLRREAVLSSKIEGTKTSLSEVFLHDRTPLEPSNPDLIEVLNYSRTLRWALQQIKTQPVSEEMIKKIHIILMKGTRGGSRGIGKYKTLQNWIGDTMDVMEARFVPSYPSSVKPLMENLVKYINSNETTIPLIRAAVMHYQFESIHPFRDGNGRIGRLLIMLSLCRDKVLSKPLLYLSAYFEKNKDEYKKRLFEASVKGDLEGWIKFFLTAVKTQSDDAIRRTNRLENYHQECIETLQETSRSNKAVATLELLFENPYIDIPEVSRKLKCHYPVAKHCVDILVKSGILIKVNRKSLHRRAQIFYAPKINRVLSED